MKAIIPAAGVGTRFLPATKEQPKEMLPVLSKPVIQYVVEEAVAAGVSDVLVVTGRGKRAIEDHFDRSVELEDLLERAGNTDKLRQIRAIPDLANVFYVRQGRPRGLGHAILCGAPHTGDEPFYVMLGDVIVPKKDCLPKLKAVYDTYGASVIAVEPVEQQYVSRYGIIGGHEVAPGVWKLTELVEKPPANQSPSNLAIFGRYLLTPQVMRILPHVEAGRGGEIQLTDALRKLLETEDIYAVTMDCEGYDTGNVLSWLEANVVLALETDEYGPALRESLGRMLG
ncbi:MAG: UTP--glucose-1-phosphate uridylyltransferase GalU [Actinobacteria bacterium]|nr:UTP--glucose-1-phosphate uridylyltransferase GalU [Actinomycetota bacterium]